MIGIETMTKEFLQFEFVEGYAFINHPLLRQRLYQLVSQSYKNTDQLINRIFLVNDIAFMAKDGDKIIGVLLFSFTSRCTVQTNNQQYTAIYNGYAVTDINYRNLGILQKLISFATTEFNNRIHLENSKLLLYAITSNPYALKAYRKVCAYIEPFTNGSFTETGRQIAKHLKQELGINLSDSEHPFKFTTSLPQRYSEFEQENLDKAPITEKLFLQTLGVIESLGDRILFFWLPEPLS